MSLPIVRSVAALRVALAAVRSGTAAPRAATAARAAVGAPPQAERVALVPTMGALHAGHLALLAAARASGATHVVASVFVNPTQFGVGEDFDRYPRDEAADAAALAAAGCDLLFAPTVAEVYPAGFATTVSVAGLTDVLDGPARPGHFAGVATVVAKLLIAAAPDLAVFGEKDWQQLIVIRRLVADLALPVEIVGAPIVRDGDGLALSSRNAYLSTDERARAVALPQALAAAQAALRGGAAVAPTLAGAAAMMVAAGFDEPDYVALVDAALRPVAALAGPARLLTAARIGGTRLIDNLPV